MDAEKEEATVSFLQSQANARAKGAHPSGKVDHETGPTNPKPASCYHSFKNADVESRCAITALGAVKRRLLAATGGDGGLKSD